MKPTPPRATPRPKLHALLVLVAFLLVLILLPRVVFLVVFFGTLGLDAVGIR